MLSTILFYIIHIISYFLTQNKISRQNNSRVTLVNENKLNYNIRIFIIHYTKKINRNLTENIQSYKF